MKAYIRTNYTGKGFITHEDQEKNGLSFRILISNPCIVMVSGEDGQVITWKNRVKGTYVTSEYVDTLGKQLLVDSKPGMIADLEQQIDDINNKTFSITNY